MKPVKLVQSKAVKVNEMVNVEVMLASKSSINIDSGEARKIQEHFDAVTARLQKAHKSVIWNMYIGRSFIEKMEEVSRPGDEISIDGYSPGQVRFGFAKITLILSVKASFFN